MWFTHQQHLHWCSWSTIVLLEHWVVKHRVLYVNKGRCPHSTVCVKWPHVYTPSTQLHYIYKAHEELLHEGLWWSQCVIIMRTVVITVCDHHEGLWWSQSMWSSWGTVGDHRACDIMRGYSDHRVVISYELGHLRITTLSYWNTTYVNTFNILCPVIKYDHLNNFSPDLWLFEEFLREWLILQWVLDPK